MIRRRLKVCLSRCSWRRTRRRPGSSLISMPPTIRCTGIRKGGSFTATTTATATCRSTSSAAVTCWRRSCGPPTSMPRPGRSRRSPGSWRRSARAGRHAHHSACRLGLCARRADELVREPTASTSSSGWPGTSVLCARSGPSWPRRATESRASGEPARRFKELIWSTRRSWSRERRVIAKAEWTQGEANPRFIVTSLTAADGDGRHLYEASTAPAARWRTASRSVRWTCSPIAHPPPP